MREGRELVSGRSAEHAPRRGLAPCRATRGRRPGARSERGSGPDVEESHDGGVLQLSREPEDVADDESDTDGAVQRTGDLVVTCSVLARTGTTRVGPEPSRCLAGEFDFVGVALRTRGCLDLACQVGSPTKAQ